MKTTIMKLQLSVMIVLAVACSAVSAQASDFKFDCTNSGGLLAFVTDEGYQAIDPATLVVPELIPGQTTRQLVASSSKYRVWLDRYENTLDISLTKIIDTRLESIVSTATYDLTDGQTIQVYYSQTELAPSSYAQLYFKCKIIQ